jgi:hypothetical protein
MKAGTADDPQESPADPVTQDRPTEAVRAIVNLARTHIPAKGAHGESLEVFLSPGERHVLGACVALVRSVHGGVYEERGEEFARTTAAVRNVTEDFRPAFDTEAAQGLTTLDGHGGSPLPPRTERLPKRKADGDGNSDGPKRPKPTVPISDSNATEPARNARKRAHSLPGDISGSEDGDVGEGSSKREKSS